MKERYDVGRVSDDYWTAQLEVKLREPAYHFYTALLKEDLINRAVVYGLGTANAHARLYSYDEWCRLWKRNNKKGE